MLSFLNKPLKKNVLPEHTLSKKVSWAISLQPGLKKTISLKMFVNKTFLLCSPSLKLINNKNKVFSNFTLNLHLIFCISKKLNTFQKVYNRQNEFFCLSCESLQLIHSHNFVWEFTEKLTYFPILFVTLRSKLSK